MQNEELMKLLNDWCFSEGGCFEMIFRGSQNNSSKLRGWYNLEETMGFICILFRDCSFLMSKNSKNTY